ncbi:hypothetical protein ACHAQA_008195 [Verticillium albo-atrum]
MHGYSSSEESDDPKRPRALPVATTSTTDKKAKKKKKPLPQQSINRIWKTFQKRNFNTALAVLPFDPVPPPVSPERPNELMSAGYERAVEECRRKVKKIIQECRRVNQRYRDPGWDLDWDLKWYKGHCLNRLGATDWLVNKATLSDSSATVPKAVKRVHEIFEKPTFMEKVDGRDIQQGSIGNCWLIASFTALANEPESLRRICVEYDTRIGIYGFVFYRDGEWIYSIIDDKLYLKSPTWDSRSKQRELLQQIDREDQERVYRQTYQTGSKALFFGRCIDQNETWVPLMEKAYAKAHGDYASLVGGWIGEALEDLSGGVTTEILTSDILDLDSFWEKELSKVNSEFMFGCSTGLLECGYGDRVGICEGHAYVIMEAKTLSTGKRLVKLRNPWGKIRKGIWEGAWSDGSREWTPEFQAELGHQFGNDSVFWISYDDFLNKFQHFDRTRLFNDPKWRCCQRWIGVDVPWKPQYNEKFQVRLTKDSPMVIALSQLDKRYFKGLQGQYRFELHFRIHEKGRSNAEDYIVRSHGNYLMNRSVSVEIPDMPAGDYSIFISVKAERYTACSSVEDVVKRECKNRSGNAKLAQVGYAYDLAHSKATAHLEEVARLRKEKEQKKASTLRQVERRRLWERRHLERQVTKKQKAKNREKKEQRIAKAKEEADEGDDEEDEADAEEAPVPEKSKDQSTPDTPEVAKDEAVNPEGGKTDQAAEVGLQPKPSPAKKQTSKKVVPVSDGESSDSPIEDHELLFSDDDLVRKPRAKPAGPPLTKAEIYESEDENAPEPWNAICVIGVRIYTLDEDLELKVVMEGGDLEEGGMGKKGGADLDNAQANAGGERENDAEPAPAPAPASVQGDGDNGDDRTKDGDQKKLDDDVKSEKSSDSSEFDKLDSGATTPGVLITPTESEKELC